MKTKTIITALFILFSISSFAQTKEETIEWLNTNGKSLSHNVKELEKGYLTKYFDKIENNYMIFKLDWTLKEGDTYNYEILYKIPIKSLLYEDVSTLVNEDSQICFLLDGSGYETIRTGNREEKSIEKTDRFCLKIKNNNEENIKRVLKAIMHLAKLSGAKENKQTF